MNQSNKIIKPIRTLKLTATSIQNFFAIAWLLASYVLVLHHIESKGNIWSCSVRTNTQTHGSTKKVVYKPRLTTEEHIINGSTRRIHAYCRNHHLADIGRTRGGWGRRRGGYTLIMSSAAVSSLRRTTEPRPRCTNLVAALASVLNAALAAAGIAIAARENPTRRCSLSWPPSDSSVSISTNQTMYFFLLKKSI
jgi:hypothetical protein